MMKKIAIVAQESLSDRKGSFNAIWNRIYNLKLLGQYDIDVFFIQNYFPWYIRMLRGCQVNVSRPSEMDVNGIIFKVYYHRISLFVYLLEFKLHMKHLVHMFMVKRIAPQFSKYDLVSAHSTVGAEIALYVKQKYSIPYCVTWHGSDIHTDPWKNKNEYELVRRIMKSSELNFFVSNALLKISDKIITDVGKKILYNSASKDFFKYEISEKRNFKKELSNEEDCKIIAFVGNLLPIKNPMVLPNIFKSVKEKYIKKLFFWIIGDGKLRYELQKEMEKEMINCVFWGNQPVLEMPKFMNCIDVLVLPSINEGLPLVTVEALKCGANVVGSNVGGISEAIGIDNVFKLDNNFVENISNRIVEMLNNTIEQNVPELLDWSKTAELESQYYNKILNK